ncbi:MAG TPA: 3-phosphoshikimate 1-carboxyvinyltransferase [Pyrinomonadaceae bacterium]|nr:3-phosphoshikimate 1-carboxyvinyltransferase [Pyrinomonadaceae bacterium]
MTNNNDRVDIEDGPVTVTPVNRLRGELCLPGDKSISHRAAMIASIAHGESILENFSSAQDCAATLDCLQALGVRVEKDGSTITIFGTGASGLQKPAEILNAQNSGTTMRLLSGILASQPFETTITGDDSLLSRPMKRVAEPLRLMGAEVVLAANGCAPLRIKGQRPLRAVEYQLPIASAQIKSAVLLAGLAADGITTVEEPAPTRDHTEHLLSEFGARIERNGKRISIRGGAELSSRRLFVPGDISSAAFFIAAAASLPGSDLLIRDVGLNPTRTAFLSALRTLGADIVVSDERLEGGEPVGSLRIRSDTLKESRSLEISGAEISNLIDELPLLGFVAASLGCKMTLRDAGELRVKESDRIAATVANLVRMGAHAEERADGWLIESTGKLHGASLSAFGDHRIAMGCAVAALSAQGPSQIEGAANSVDVSLPEFWRLLKSVSH